jgi:VWFA-related protein
MIERARASDAIIYIVSNANRRDGTPSNPRLLRKLADVTGGVAFFPDDDKAVIESFDTLAANIRRGYMVGYMPTNTAHDGGYRRVKIEVTVPGRRSLQVRSRDGYRTAYHQDGR